jgi:hypothetical protein
VLWAGHEAQRVAASMRHIDPSSAPRLECELIAYSDGEHVQQIYTGFNLLHRQGVARVRQTIPADCLLNKTDPARWVDYRFSNVRAIVNGRTTICYDVHDWNRIDERILGEVDFYFKRSFDPRHVATLPERHKVFPLGLNYRVLSAEADRFRFERSVFYASRARVKAILKSLMVDRLVRGQGDAERLDNLEASPDFTAEPRVLFMARAWDTNHILDSTQRDLVHQLNEVRAECVRRLRKELGDRFFGGLAHDAFAFNHYSDVLLPDAGLANKRRYLEVLKGYPICIATTGLNGSNGWKLGEYVAHSKAIVTEPLHHAVPGDFAQGTHFLEFATPDGLLEATTRLLEDRELRCAMMVNNYRYYRAYVRPDVLILNSLATALGREANATVPAGESAGAAAINLSPHHAA